MSESIQQHEIKTFIERLVQQSKPNSNDERYNLYVRATNEFLKYFGQEKLYLLGSTGEQTKLRTEKDSGDTDVLICTGKLEISVTDIEPRDDVPCFVWIKKGTNVDLKLDFVDGVYLPSSVLRSVEPEFFTIVRGIYNIATLTSFSIFENNKRVTKTGLQSKVGLALNQYRHLVIDEKIKPLIKTANTNLKTEKSVETMQRLQKRKVDVPFNSKDVESFSNILEVMTLFRKPVKNGGNSPLNYFAELLHTVLQRIKEEESLATAFVADGLENDHIVHYYQNDLNTPSTVESQHIPDKRQTLEDELKNMPDTVIGSYQSKTSKDFVPAIRLAGKLPFMEGWKASKKQLGWPSPEIVDEIYDLDVFVVSKYAPENPDIDRDFCLSFNLAEMKLAKCLEPVQRNVLLILKCYLKGVIANKCKQHNCNLKLTTFHLKTTLYRVLENADLVQWHEDNILTVVIEVLEFLTNALCERELLHFFVPNSNLFHGFNDEDYAILLECLTEIQADPIGSIATFFKLDDGQPTMIEFNRDELLELMELKDDGGRNRVADAIEDAMIDFQRGFNDGPRDVNGIAPINEAILDVVKIFLKDEGNKMMIRELTKLNITKEFLSTYVPGLVESFASSNKGEELFVTIKQFLDCPNSDKSRKNRYLIEIEKQGRKLFNY